MSVDAGDLTSVRSSLEDLGDTYENDDFSSVVRQLENQLSGDNLQQYESADFNDNPIEVLEQAAADANLSDKYAQIFANASSLRRALAEVAAEAFDSSARQMLADQASASNLDRAYTFCARGQFDEAADAANMDDQDFEHAADCKHQVAIEGGYARALFSGYRDSDSDETYVEPATPTDPNA